MIGRSSAQLAGAHAVRRGLDRVLATICVLLFALLVLTVGWQVFTRQVLGEPSTWSEELAKYVFVWLGMFGAALVFSERGHFAVDFVVRKFSQRAQRVVAVLVQVAIIVFAILILVWGGARITGLAWGQSLSSLPAHLGVVYLVLPISGVIITFYAVHHMILVVRGAQAPVEDADDTAEEP